MKVKKVKFYGLREAEDAARYVGKTELTLGKRRGDHWREARTSKETSHKINWLRTLKTKPEIFLIEEFSFVEEQEWKEREKYWIALFRDYGHRLTNTTVGGDGLGSGPEHPCFGKKHTDAWRLEKSLAMTGVGHPMFNKKHAPESRERMRIAKLGRALAPEHCTKLQVSQQKRRLRERIERDIPLMTRPHNIQYLTPHILWL